MFGKNQVVAANGDDWKRHRMTMDRVFILIEVYQQICQEKSIKVLDSMTKESNDGISISGSLKEDLLTYNYMINSIFKLPGNPFMKKLNDVIDKLDTLFYKLINEAKFKVKNLDSWADLSTTRSKLDHLVHANMAQGSNHLTDEEVRDNVMVFFIAGYETTSASLLYIITRLSQFTDIQEKLRNEIQSIIGAGLITMENVNKCEYLQCVINEITSST